MLTNGSKKTIWMSNKKQAKRRAIKKYLSLEVKVGWVTDRFTDLFQNSISSELSFHFLVFFCGVHHMQVYSENFRFVWNGLEISKSITIIDSKELPVEKHVV